LRETAHSALGLRTASVDRMQQFPDVFVERRGPDYLPQLRHTRPSARTQAGRRSCRRARDLCQLAGGLAGGREAPFARATPADARGGGRRPRGSRRDYRLRSPVETLWFRKEGLFVSSYASTPGRVTLGPRVATQQVLRLSKACRGRAFDVVAQAGL
jgi:hypothetical protein